ncbi:hypothetical protein POV27_07435 [Aureisphaera galaxeae]|uniref:DUF7010 family protein n=1 Tax=Aureisphaera galaxeae TaxID=1538023 RepID=UPI002350A67F|nr:hypothetical protein [Aureisphaera galaxeae]MDC8003879.1 hypothetical protein [Aureisphaera galaxeae]
MNKTSSNQPMDKSATLNEAQRDMCSGYAVGAVGVLVSGSVWLISAFVATYFSANIAIWTLLIGGAAISPISSIIEKFMGLNGHKKGNPLKNLAMESTVWMIMCLPLAYGLSLQKVEWFFQAMLLIIGGRYLTFATLFGKRVYWFLGASLGIAAFLLFRFEMKSFGSLLTGSLIEIVYGIFMYVFYRKTVMKIGSE